MPLKEREREDTACTRHSKRTGKAVVRRHCGKISFLTSRESVRHLLLVEEISSDVHSRWYAIHACILDKSKYSGSLTVHVTH